MNFKIQGTTTVNGKDVPVTVEIDLMSYQCDGEGLIEADGEGIYLRLRDPGYEARRAATVPFGSAQSESEGSNG
jgi:hypothetical protein